MMPVKIPPSGILLLHLLLLDKIPRPPRLERLYHLHHRPLRLQTTPHLRPGPVTFISTAPRLLRLEIFYHRIGVQHDTQKDVHRDNDHNLWWRVEN